MRFPLISRAFQVQVRVSWPGRVAPVMASTVLKGLPAAVVDASHMFRCVFLVCAYASSVFTKLPSSSSIQMATMTARGTPEAAARSSLPTARVTGILSRSDASDRGESREMRSALKAALGVIAGIALAVDDGEFERGLALCDQAIALGLGKAYAAKRASIERMM